MSVFPGVGSFPTHEGPSSGRGPNLGAFIGRGVPENRATGLGAGKEAGGSATPLSGRQHLFQIGFAALFLDFISFGVLINVFAMNKGSTC